MSLDTEAVDALLMLCRDNPDVARAIGGCSRLASLACGAYATRYSVPIGEVRRAANLPEPVEAEADHAERARRELDREVSRDRDAAESMRGAW